VRKTLDLPSRISSFSPFIYPCRSDLWLCFFDFPGDTDSPPFCSENSTSSHGSGKSGVSSLSDNSGFVGSFKSSHMGSFKLRQKEMAKNTIVVPPQMAAQLISGKIPDPCIFSCATVMVIIPVYDRHDIRTRRISAQLISIYDDIAEEFGVTVRNGRNPTTMIATCNVVSGSPRDHCVCMSRFARMMFKATKDVIKVRAPDMWPSLPPYAIFAVFTEFSFCLVHALSQFGSRTSVPPLANPPLILKFLISEHAGLERHFL
jgi:hypothetical protein